MKEQEARDMKKRMFHGVKICIDIAVHKAIVKISN